MNTNHSEDNPQRQPKKTTMSETTDKDTTKITKRNTEGREVRKQTK